MALRRFLPQVEVILMVVLGWVEGHHLSDLRGGTVAHLHQLAEDLDGRVALLGVVEPNGGEVLRANVNALTVGLLKVVDLKEITNQGFVGNLFRVVFHFDGLQMPCQARLDLFVTRIVDVSAHKADRRLRHALEALEVILHAPETTR